MASMQRRRGLEEFGEGRKLHFSYRQLQISGGGDTDAQHFNFDAEFSFKVGDF